ncbi:MAG TPA: hypothetical protein VNL35_09935 [Chloroflexota bacterium]|nr:hypothetical protein [Chloroflexota bacterium]
MAQLESADSYLSMARAEAISRVPAAVLTAHAEVGRLRALMHDGAWHTTRRWLHHYLLNDLGDHRSLPLPQGYVSPEGEPQRKLRFHELSSSSSR